MEQQNQLLDTSELTLELIHILELIDNPSNYPRVLKICSKVQDKLADLKQIMGSISISPETLNKSLLMEAQLSEKSAKLSEQISIYRENLERLRYHQ